jgi:hypothetical protein
MIFHVKNCCDENYRKLAGELIFLNSLGIIFFNNPDLSKIEYTAADRYSLRGY